LPAGIDGKSTAGRRLVASYSPAITLREQPRNPRPVTPPIRAHPRNPRPVNPPICEHPRNPRPVKPSDPRASAQSASREAF
jgi:hypothetical protein